MNKVILAFDSFKGCVSAEEISQRLKDKIERDFRCAVQILRLIATYIS